MSGIWQRWQSKDGWYAMAWFGSTAEYAGPFVTENEAIVWIEGRRR